MESLFAMTRCLPFVLFLAVPYLYDTLVGYSVIICILIACIFIAFSCFNWLELKSRYLFVTNTDLNTQIEWNCSILYIFKVTFGINLAIIMCLCFLINAMFLHSLTIKWFHRDVISSLLNESFDFLNSTQYSNKLNSYPGTGKFIEVGLNFVYLICLVVAKISLHNYCFANSKHLNLIVTFFFYVLILFVLVFTLSSSEFKVKISCEDFFKNRLNVLNGVLICVSCYWSFIHSEFIRPSEHPVKKRNKEYSIKFQSIFLKLLVFTCIVILFVILVNTFSIYRNEYCYDFSYSFMRHSHHLLRKLMLLFISLFVFQFAHYQLTELFIKNSILIHECLFSSSLSHSVQLSNQRGSNEIIYEELTVQKERNQIKYECISLFGLFMMSSIVLVCAEKSHLILIWSASFLLINLAVVSGVLLMRYFPYQIIVSSTNKKSNRMKFLFLTKEELPLVRQQTLIKESHNHNDQNESEYGQDEGLLIDNAFQEHKSALKNLALSDHSLRFGSNQPSMKSAYRALTGYVIFIICSIVSSLIVNHLKSLNSQSITISQLIFEIIVFLFNTLIQLFFTFIFLINNSKETIYVNQLDLKSPFTPYSQLFISYFNIVLIFQIDFYALLMFCLILISLICLLVLVQTKFNRNKIKTEPIAFNNKHMSESSIYLIRSIELGELQSVSSSSNLII